MVHCAGGFGGLLIKSQGTWSRIPFKGGFVLKDGSFESSSRPHADFLIPTLIIGSLYMDRMLGVGVSSSYCACTTTTAARSRDLPIPRVLSHRCDYTLIEISDECPSATGLSWNFEPQT